MYKVLNEKFIFRNKLIKTLKRGVLGCLINEKCENSGIFTNCFFRDLDCGRYVNCSAKRYGDRSFIFIEIEN